MRYLRLLLLVTMAFSMIAVDGQRRKRNSSTPASSGIQPDTSLYNGLKWRNIGPHRGGRSVAVTGVPGNDRLYYMGGTGGGIWKTEDAGLNWRNISDGFLKTGSVGDIRVSPSDPNIIYVGMGEHAVRGVMTSYGDGVYRSLDAGKTWQHLGLEASRHISDIVIHPTNPDKVWVAAQGAVHGPTQDRGVYLTEDGGKTWTRKLFVNETTGASSLVLDPSNPRILYAAMWDHIRYPWQVRSGGVGSGIYKSTDGGETWKKLSKGLPQSMGKIGVTVSPANPNRLWAVVEAEKGGVYRSENGGSTWSLVCSDRITITRSWYYMEIFADPKDQETVYVLNAPALKSIDGGRTFRPMPVGHGDTHDLWINPTNPNNLILGDDGGAEISFNQGATWSSLNNQPTSQFYRVNTDNQFPYNVYGGQQDNSSVIIQSRSPFGEIGEKNWTYGPGCESAYLAFDPDNPVLVYGGCYQGYIEELNTSNFTSRDIMAYPNLGLGSTPLDLKYRFNWNAPIVANPHNYEEIYHAGNVLFMTNDRGISWDVISPDLTRNDKSKQIQGGGPITNEGAGGENYNTIMYVAVSPHKDGTIWVGSDDGLLHVTRDKGGNWAQVTPPGLGETMINSIEVSPHDDNTVYVVSTKYKFNDYHPMVHRTTDGGKTWKKIVSGIADNDFIRVVREDKVKKGLLYAGSETGLYISLNGGENWSKFTLNLPIVPINDLAIQDNDLVAATAGRGFWILDDLSAIQQGLGSSATQSQIFSPKDTYRVSFGGRGNANSSGQNPLTGAIIDYYIPEQIDTAHVSLEIINASGEVIRTYTNKKDPDFRPYPGGPSPEMLLKNKKGINRVAWDFRKESLPNVPGVFILGNYSGSIVPPGTYSLRFTWQDQVTEAPLELLPDPRIERSASDYTNHFAFSEKIVEAVSEIHSSVSKIRDVRKQIQSHADWLSDTEKADTLISFGKEILKEVKDWEGELIQPKQKTFQDVINFPNQITSEFLDLKSRIEGQDPMLNQGAKNRYNDLINEWETAKDQLEGILDMLNNYNELYKELDLPVVITGME